MTFIDQKPKPDSLFLLTFLFNDTERLFCVMTEQFCDTDDDDEQNMKRSYEDGQWTWDDKIQGLNFVRLVLFRNFKKYKYTILLFVCIHITNNFISNYMSNKVTKLNRKNFTQNI